MEHLINKVVKRLDNPINDMYQFGILMKIGEGRYPYILKFYDGNVYGVSNISDEQPIEDSVIEIALRNI